MMSASFVYVTFVLNPIQMLSILLYPVSKSACWRINRWCARSLWGWWSIMAEKQNDIGVRVSGDALPYRENAFVITNHQSIADIMVSILLAWRCGRVGDMKFFVKDILKWLPGPGWGMYMLNCIFLKRNWANDKKDVLALFDKFKRNDIPMFLVSYVEGTRITPEKLARSQAFAEKRGLYVPQATMVPRTKGFCATIQGLGNHLDAVYDVTIGYQGDTIPSMLDCFLRKVKHVDIHVKRFAIADLPQTDEDLSAWLIQRYVEKDQMMVQYQDTGQFPGEEHFGPINAWHYLRAEDSPVRLQDRASKAERSSDQDTHPR